MTFRLYGQKTEGVALWSETVESVGVTEGSFSLPLGGVEAFPAGLFGNPGLWLELVVDGDTLTPREPLTSVPWARRAFSVSGPVEATTVVVDDNEVIDASGEWTGPAPTDLTCSGCVDPSDLAFSYLTSESDPEVGTLTAGSWCTSDGTEVNCTASPPVTSESDPQVGANTVNYIPKWDGSALVSGSIYDNGNVGIGTLSPAGKLHTEDIQYDMGSGLCPAGYAEGDYDGEADEADCKAIGIVAQANGNVGIGTTSPQTKLDVNGEIRASGGTPIYSCPDRSLTWQDTGCHGQLSTSSTCNKSAGQPGETDSCTLVGRLVAP